MQEVLAHPRHSPCLFFRILMALGKAIRIRPSCDGLAGIPTGVTVPVLGRLPLTPLAVYRALADWARWRYRAELRPMPAGALVPDEGPQVGQQHRQMRFLKTMPGCSRWIDPIASNTLQPFGLEPLASPVGVALCASGPVRSAFVGAMDEVCNMHNLHVKQNA